MLHEKNKAKAKKTAHIEEIWAQLHGTIGARHTHVMDEDDDEDEKVYMYPIDMHPDERDGYRDAIRASKATEWERQQYETIMGSKRKTGELSCLSGALTMQKSQRIGIEPPSPYEIKNKYFEMEYKDMESYMNQQREKWKTYDCTIMSDGWTGPTRLNVIRNGRKITNFIYNYGWLLAEMRKYYGGDIV
ncbi:hypothetical protein CK203_028648 [Vitis vinifera]|uniref:Uncharacterized protein n=1 Tax=Vitis vinifera TaxID=29760 RepID=A0A438IFG2_VITVI|nr:hypothetical protein CK203_028648 [Vitis vinifera]